MTDKTTLQLILDKQAEFQKQFGYHEGMDQKELIQLIHVHSMFLVEEVYEMLRELPHHKPWKDYSDWDGLKTCEQLEKAKMELIDQFIFMANIAVFLGMDEDNIKQKYLEKNNLNIERQENPELGYIKN